MPDPIAACGQSHSRRWHAQNVAKRPGEVTGEARPGKLNGRSAAARWAGESPPPPSDVARHLVVVGARRMGTFNGGQRLGLRRRGACVET